MSRAKAVTTLGLPAGLLAAIPALVAFKSELLALGLWGNSWQVVGAWAFVAGVVLADHVKGLLRRWLGVALVLAALVLAGCSTVTVQAQHEGRCRIRAAAPFEVRCWSDGREVLVWTGPMALEVLRDE